MGEISGGILGGLLKKFDLRKRRGKEPPARPEEEVKREQPLAVPAEPEEGADKAIMVDLREIRAALDADLSPAERVARAAADAEDDARRAAKSRAAQSAPAPVERTEAVRSAALESAGNACREIFRQQGNNPELVEQAVQIFFDQTGASFANVEGLRAFLVKEFFPATDVATVPFALPRAGEGGEGGTLQPIATEWEITLNVNLGKENPRLTSVTLTYFMGGKGGHKPALTSLEVVKL